MNLPKSVQIEILAIKINEVEMSEEINKEDKETIKKIYRKKLKEIQPNIKL
ncbi:MAG: hypothetical protein ABI441_03715 [Flavobacterium sp.]